MQIYNLSMCCGLAEAYLTSPHKNDGTNDTPEEFIGRVGLLKKAFVILSQVSLKPAEAGYDFEMISRIRANALGEVWEADWRRNPNSSNELKVWIWAIDHKACIAYASAAASAKVGKDVTSSWHA